MTNYSMSTILVVIAIILAVIFIYLLIRKKGKPNKNEEVENEKKEIIEIKRKEARILKKLTKEKRDVESKLKSLSKNIPIKKR